MRYGYCVVARNFKAAGNISEEIKQQEELKRAHLQYSSELVANINTIEEALAQIKTQRTELETRFQHLEQQYSIKNSILFSSKY